MTKENDIFILDVLKHLEIAKSALIDNYYILHELEIDEIQKIQNTLMHIHFYCESLM